MALLARNEMGGGRELLSAQPAMLIATASRIIHIRIIVMQSAGGAETKGPADKASSRELFPRVLITPFPTYDPYSRFMAV
jgi:hypothetical protein